MATQKLHIKIIDTNENELELISEHTEMQAPTLNYNGGDDKFTHIMASQLTFNMLVTDGADGKFLHLFTGNETRYPVILEDITDAENPIHLWNGFLFPEQYSETFGGKTFFVNFSASDGLGRLKNKYLGDDYYNQKQPITQIIAECLKLTGNNLPLLIAPAIQNATVDFTIDNLEIDTTIFNEKDKPNSAYEILERCLKTLVATIFQYKGSWYIIGFNRNNTLQLAVESYNANGIYIENKTVARNGIIGKFNTEATINIVPPFKTVNVNWSPNNEDSILPSNIVTEKLSNVNFGDWNAATNWEVTQSEASSFFSFRYNKNFKSEFDFLNDSGRITPGDYYIGLSGTAALTTLNQFQNYISLKNKLYVDTDYLDPLIVNLKIEVRLLMTGTVSDEVINELTNRVYYKVFLAGEEVVTNDPVNGIVPEYDFSFTKESEYVVSGALELNNFTINEDGELDIRLYPALTSTDFGNEIQIILFKTLTLTIAEEIKEDYELNRAIDFTTEQSIDLEIGSTANSFITNTIEISENVPFAGVEVDVPEVNYQINVLAVVNESVSYSGGYFYFSTIFFSEVDYNYLLQNEANLFFKKEGSETFTQVVSPNFFSNPELDEFGIELFSIVGYLFVDGDELYIKRAAETVMVTDRNYLHQTWKQYGGSENEIYINILMKAYHSAMPTSLKTVNGSLFGLVWPLDLIEFNYINPLVYQITNSTLNLTAGETEVTLIEAKTDINITDYE